MNGSDGISNKTVIDKFIDLLCYLLKYKLIVYYSSYLYLFIFFLYATEKQTLEDHSYRSTNNVPTPIYPQKIQVTFSEEKVLSL